MNDIKVMLAHTALRVQAEAERAERLAMLCLSLGEAAEATEHLVWSVHAREQADRLRSEMRSLKW